MLRIIAIALAALSLVQAVSIRSLYQFPPQIWVENHLRLPNNSLLVSTFTSPDLYVVDVDSKTPTAKLWHHYALPATSTLGLASPADGQVASIVGKIEINATAGANPPLTASNWQVTLFDTSGPAAVVRRVYPVPNSGLLNGLTIVPGNKDIVLAADSLAGKVWRINFATGVVDAPLVDPLFAPVVGGQSVIGINGAQAPGDGYLYFTNTARGVLARIAITKAGGPAGPAAQILYTSPAGENLDDFTVDWDGTVYLAAGGINAVLKLTNGGTTLAATYQNQTILNHPTSVQIGVGPDTGSLLVTTAGQLEGGPATTGGGRVSKITF